MTKKWLNSLTDPRIRKIYEELYNKEKQELKDRKAKGLCNAVLHHGRGHQSKTFCQCIGEHKKHRTEYGRYGEVMEWKGMKAFTGFFDEPL